MSERILTSWALTKTEYDDAMRGEVIEQSTSEGLESAKKQPKLEDISMMAATPLQEWLENLPQNDLQYVALLLYTSLPRSLVFRKHTTAAVAKFLQKSDHTI